MKKIFVVVALLFLSGPQCVNREFEDNSKPPTKEEDQEELRNIL